MAEHPDHSDPQIPDTLHADLRALYAPGAGVPADVSARILNRARAELAHPRRSRRTLLRWAGAAAAAAIGVAIWFAYPQRDTPDQVATVAADVNGDGRVDILDALVLARRIEEGRISPGSARYDLNRDGVIDRHDADAIAIAAVRLDGGGVQ